MLKEGGDAIEAQENSGAVRFRSVGHRVDRPEFNASTTSRQQTSAGREDFSIVFTMDPIDVANAKSLNAFVEEYMPPG